MNPSSGTITGVFGVQFDSQYLLSRFLEGMNHASVSMV
jgi:hypothetical protein